MRRAPDLVLGIDEAVDVGVRQVAEQLAQEATEYSRPAASSSSLAVASGERGRVVVTPDRGERRAVPDVEQLVVPGELDERVAPVEENGADHRTV